jgi:hypothetical protein
MMASIDYFAIFVSGYFVAFIVRTVRRFNKYNEYNLNGLVASGGARHEDQAEHCLGNHVQNSVDQHLHRYACASVSIILY